MGANIRFCNPDRTERYWPNSNYGNAQTIKAYAKYPMNKPVMAVIPHGVFYEDDYVFPGEAQANVPAVLQWPSHRDEAWGKHKHVVPMAAPFLYGLEIYPHAKERRGTVVMPQHTTTLYDMEFDWEQFYESIRGLPKPITVLLYYNDVQLGCERHFPGLRTKSCGHVNYSGFLCNLVHYMTSAEYVVSNDVGSYTYYAWAAGATFNLVGPPPRFVLNQEGIDKGFQGIFLNSEDRHPEEKRRIAEVADTLNGVWHEKPTEQHIAFADYYLRKEAFKTPEALYYDLIKCEALKGVPLP